MLMSVLKSIILNHLQFMRNILSNFFVYLLFCKSRIVTRDCNPGIRDPGRFSQSRIPGLAKPKSRDFGIEKMYFSVENSIYSVIFATNYKKTL